MPQRGIFSQRSSNKNKNIKSLISYGADVNARSSDGTTALIRASYNGYVDCIELLLEHGAEVNLKSDQSHFALHWAYAWKYTEVVTLLRKYGALMPNECSLEVASRYPESFFDDKFHVHSLAKLQRENAFTCDICKTSGFGIRYRCDDCDFDSHFTCCIPTT